MMPDYRDFLLYIGNDDRKLSTAMLIRLEDQNSRKNTISSEEDRHREAVESFYQAIALKN